MNGAKSNKTRVKVRFLFGVINLLCLLVFFPASPLGAWGRRDIKSVSLEGQEIWEADFDISRLKNGKHNIIVYARDPAGNISVDGPYNIRVDPKAGLPIARIVYPEQGSALRSDLSVIGVANGRFGIDRVTVRLDNGPVEEVEGTEYWSRSYSTEELPEGRHTVSAQAYDAKNTPGPVQEVSFILDRTPPALEISSHQSGALIKGNVTIAGFTEDINGIETLEISSDGGVEFISLPFRKKGKTGGSFSFRLKTKELQDGPLLYILRAVDGSGLETIRSYLFYVDNLGPKLDIISPKVDEAVWDTIRVTGSIIDAVGLDKFYYEWNGERVDIPIYPGDPYWAVEVAIPYRMYRGNIFKVTAIDKTGNVSTVSRQFRDLRKIRAPTLIVDYPQNLSSLTADQAIYGRIAPGYDPNSLIIEGVVEEIDAKPSFRISPELIAPGRSSLRIWAKATDDSLGAPVLLRTNRPRGAVVSVPYTSLTITSPEPYAWFRDSLVVSGHIGSEWDPVDPALFSGGRLEYRFSPDDTWKPISYNQVDGSFRVDIPVSGLDEGAVHLEFRTVLGGVSYYPYYFPVNRFTTDPTLEFISPAADMGPVNGRVTVSGVVNSVVPIETIEYTSNGRIYEPVSILAAYQKYTFSTGVNFSTIAESKGQLVIRVTDVSGNRYETPLEVEIDFLSDAPVVILNQPLIGQVITEDFTVSGLAFDDDGVEAVYWRIAKRPNPASPSSGPEPQFQKTDSAQQFEFNVPMSDLVDGDHYLELYAVDIYGFRGRTLSRLIRVSTAAPVVSVTYPPIDIYGKKVIYVEGTAVDANGIGEIRCSLDNGLTWQRGEVMGERWRLSLNTAAYADGSYTLFVRAFDNYGIETFHNALINIDNTSPDLTVAVPKNGDSVGDSLEVSGRVLDNIGVTSLSILLVNINDSRFSLEYKVEPRQVFFETIDIRRLPVGEYNMRMTTTDLAENVTLLTRNFFIVRDNSIAEAAIYNPLPGIDHTGPLIISGRVSGAIMPKEVMLRANRTQFATVPVDPYGLFYYEYPSEGIQEDVNLVFSASFNNPTGGLITSHDHEVQVHRYGAALAVDSHVDGDSITQRPWLSGRAWYTDEYREQKGDKLTWNERRFYDVEAVDVSYDNGRTYQRAVGKENWKFRLETGEMVRGPLPVLIKATFANGSVAVRRLILIVDVDAPEVRILDPIENSLHRDTLNIYGIASDDYQIADLEIQLRPGDKVGYSLPKFVQGMYLDTNIFGATYGDIGLGLSFFENNVKLQFQFGVAPEGQRFTGNVFGFKLLANILYLPMDYFFGPDWQPFSMAFALGANFSYFTMEGNPINNTPMLLGAVLAQWEMLRVTLSESEVLVWPNSGTSLKWPKYFSFYLEPIWWFASSDVADSAKVIFRATLGIKVGVL